MGIMSTDTAGSPIMLFKPAQPQAAKSDEEIALACLFMGLFLLLFGLTSLLVRGRLFLTSSVLAMGFGIALGPRVLGIVKILPGHWDTGHEGDRDKEVLLWFTRLVLSIQVLTSGVTLPSRFATREKVLKSLLVLLGPVMLAATCIVGCFAKLIFRVSWLEALLIGACLAPTDPVLASAVVKGTFAERHVPPYIRHLLLVESGINDGSATSFFLAPLLLLTRSPGEAAKEWFLTGILWETLFAMLAGTVIGWTFRVALEYAKKWEWVDKESSLVYTAALALLTTGILTYIDSNELLGCFCAGTALNWNDSIHTEDTHTHFSEAIDNVLDIAVFLVLGTVLPWQAWGDKSSPFWIGKLVGFGFCVVFLRRLPSVLVLQRLIPMVRTGKEAMFVGHFGPMGVGAIYYALKAAEELPKDSELKQGLYGIMAWMVFTSTIVHGVTVPSFLLGSALHPALHPKWLVNNEGSGDDESEHSGGEQPETTERHGLLAPLVHTLQRYGAIRGDDYKREDGEKGRPISRNELHRVMHNMAGEANEESTTTKGRSRGKLNDRQKEILLGEGTGLDWTGKDVQVYDEGSTLIITDETGKVSFRRIDKQTKKNRARRGV